MHKILILTTTFNVTLWVEKEKVPGWLLPNLSKLKKEWLIVGYSKPGVSLTYELSSALNSFSASELLIITRSLHRSLSPQALAQIFINFSMNYYTCLLTDFPVLISYMSNTIIFEYVTILSQYAWTNFFFYLLDQNPHSLTHCEWTSPTLHVHLLPVGSLLPHLFSPFLSLPFPPYNPLITGKVLANHWSCHSNSPVQISLCSCT